MRSIESELQEIDISKSREPDQFPPSFFKRTSTEIAKSMFTSFKTFVRLKRFPRKWINGIVLPIFKEDSKADVSNYHPVTLLNVVSKILKNFVSGAITESFGDKKEESN